MRSEFTDSEIKELSGFLEIENVESLICSANEHYELSKVFMSFFPELVFEGPVGAFEIADELPEKALFIDKFVVDAFEVAEFYSAFNSYGSMTYYMKLKGRLLEFVNDDGYHTLSEFLFKFRQAYTAELKYYVENEDLPTAPLDLRVIFPTPEMYERYEGSITKAFSSLLKGSYAFSKGDLCEGCGIDFPVFFHYSEGDLKACCSVGNVWFFIV
jgi:hypothetical protein